MDATVARETIGIDAWMVAWNPVYLRSDYLRAGHAPPGAVRIGPWPDKDGWSIAYEFTTGCCMSAWHQLKPDLKTAMLFIHFHTLVVRDGIEPLDVHREFLKLKQYRLHISLDIEGAEGSDPMAGEAPLL